MPLPDDAERRNWQCWEEFSEKEMQLRHVRRSVHNEQLWVGDIITWQLATEPDSPVREASENEIAPSYPVNTVADLASHLANAVEVTVILHDSAQPLCVDGIVSNGHWSAARPASAVVIKDGEKAPREERPEDAALALSLSKFRSPEEKDLKMDLRWQLHNVTGTIAQAFDLPVHPREAQLWLFHAPPSCTGEEPLNGHSSRGEQATLKELQRTAFFLSSPSKKLTLHAVELAWRPGQDFMAQGLCPLCVRFYDDVVREIGCRIIRLSNDNTMADLLAEAKKHVLPEWGMTGPLRVLEVQDSRVQVILRPEQTVRTLTCFNKSNIFYYCLRVEVAPPVPEGHSLQEIFHSDRQSQQAFAQPFLVALAPGEKCGAIKARCKAKLQVPDSEFKTWRLVRSSRSGKVHLKDDEAWDADGPSDSRLCLEHVHPNPTNSRQSRANKPLTIK